MKASKKGSTPGYNSGDWMPPQSPAYSPTPRTINRSTGGVPNPNKPVQIQYTHYNTNKP